MMPSEPFGLKLPSSAPSVVETSLSLKAAISAASGPVGLSALAENQRLAQTQARAVR